MLVALSGITGVGKSYFAQEISTTLDFKKVHTIRTRKMRQGEINGKTGFFMNEEQLNELKKQGKIIYDFKVFEGTYAYLKEEIESNDNYVFEMHYTTITDWKKVAPHIQTIYILPKDINMAIEKLKQRNLPPEIENERICEIQEQYHSFIENEQIRNQFDYMIYNNYDEESKEKIMKLIKKIMKT